jgi:hypothetical protein
MNGSRLLSYTVDPHDRALPDSTITAQVHRNSADELWDVLVLITRAPGQPPINAAEVQVQLIDERGVMLPLRMAPSGSLPEAGGLLGMSANALFKLEDRGMLLAELVVRVRGTQVTFHLTPTKPRGALSGECPGH